MRARIRARDPEELYRGAGRAESYVGEFYPGPHRFDMPMQESAFAYLAGWLR